MGFLRLAVARVVGDGFGWKVVAAPCVIDESPRGFDRLGCYVGRVRPHVGDQPDLPLAWKFDTLIQTLSGSHRSPCGEAERVGCGGLQTARDEWSVRTRLGLLFLNGRHLPASGGINIALDAKRTNRGPLAVFVCGLNQLWFEQADGLAQFQQTVAVGGLGFAVGGPRLLRKFHLG